MRLRPVRPSDAAEAFRQIHGREEILKWLLWGGPRSEEELEEAFSRWSQRARGDERRSDFLFAIVERATDRFLGTINLRFADHPESADVGYWIAEHAWNRGYTSEAIALATHFAFEHLDATSTYAWVFVGNEASKRVLEKNGYELVRTVYGKVERDGKKRDEWYLVLLRTDWEAREEDWRPVREEVRGS